MYEVYDREHLLARCQTEQDALNVVIATMKHHELDYLHYIIICETDNLHNIKQIFHSDKVKDKLLQCLLSR